MSDTTQFAGMESNQDDGSLRGHAVLLSRYKITGVLGGGGMGTVYQARDLHFPDAYRLVAIKEMQTMTTDAALRTSMLKTFQREANLLATLSHAAIPKIFDFFDQNDRAYLVMEYINGSDLELLLQKTKELPMEKIIDWAIALCDVLYYLHSHTPEPIVFRDMKPPNVMIDSRGNVRLIDFGIAKIFVSGIKHTMIGTEGYSAPEQYKGDVTPQSDIYSLGATLHHVLTRKDPRLEPPFSFNERPISQFNPKAPPRLGEIIEKAVAFEPRDRFQTCLEMKDALEELRFRPFQMPVATIAQQTFDDYQNTGTIQPRWKFNAEDEIRGGATVVAGRVFFGSYDTNLWALQLENGALAWKYATNGGVAATPAGDDNNRSIMFGSEDGSFYALDTRTGRVNWRFDAGDRIRSSPRVTHDHVFFGSDDGKLYCLHAGNGRFLWAYDTSSPVRTRPFVTNEVVIVGSDSGEIIGLELSGSRKWSYRTRRAILSSPVVDSEGICYIGSQDQFLYALDAINGYSSWRFRCMGPIISSPVVSDNVVFIGSADGFMYAINTHSGKEKWKFNADKPIVGSPVINRGMLYFGGTDGHLYCIDAETGRERWKFRTAGALTGTPLITNDLIIFGSLDRTLYAIPLVG